MTERVLRIKEVVERTGLSRSTLDRLVKSGDFPEARQLGRKGSRAKGWLLSEVEDWIVNRPRVA